MLEVIYKVFGTWFKIDLIVWKFFDKVYIGVSVIWFKIDLIVWKCK